MGGERGLQGGRGVIGAQVQPLNIHGVDHQQIPVLTVPGRRGSSHETGKSGIVFNCTAPEGNRELSREPAPAGREVTSAGMFTTAQCQ
jgi:hypothetical protein